MSMVHHEDSGDIQALAGKTVGVVGYNPVARAMALNLRDSGIPVIVAVLNADQSTAAEGDSVPIASASEVARRSPVLLLLASDEYMPEIYMGSISPYLQRGHSLIFSSAYNVAYGYIEAPTFVDVGMVSPRVDGETVRAAYLNQDGYHSFVAVGQDASRKAWPTVLAVALAVGALRGGAVEITMEQEAQLSLFVQQAIIPAFHHIMVTAASLLLRSGYPAEAALPDLYLSGKFNDYLQQADRVGLLNAILQNNRTGQYGTFTRIDRFKDLKLERLMEVTLEEIQNGDFAREWAREFADGFPRLQKLVRMHQGMDLWDWEQQTLDFLGH